MKKYTRSLTLSELRLKCAESGFVLDTTRHDQGSDYVTIYFKHSGKKLNVVFNTFNGTFIVKRNGEMVTGSSALDGTPWFDAILDFIYTNEARAA